MAFLALKVTIGIDKVVLGDKFYPFQGGGNFTKFYIWCEGASCPHQCQLIDQAHTTSLEVFWFSCTSLSWKLSDRNGCLHLVVLSLRDRGVSFKNRFKF